VDILGSIGQLYTFVLLVLLVLGFGLAVWAGLNSIGKKKEHFEKFINSKLELIKNICKSGGNQMKNNNFIKLAVFSFMGIIVSVAILSVLPSMSNAGKNMYGNGAMVSATMQGMSNTTMQNSMTGQYPDTTAIQQQLNTMQQQINQLQYQLNNSSMSNSNMNSNNMNNNSMSNNNSNSGNMSNSSSNSGSMSNSSSSGGMSMGMM